MEHKAKSENPVPYLAKPAKNADDLIIGRALAILESRMRIHGHQFDKPESVKDYCKLHIGGLDHEVFAVLFLDSQHRMIAFDVMFRGTLSQTSVYPREVVITALQHKAAAVVLTHNHPSGSASPSRADELLTQTLKAALALVDVRILDHIIVTPCAALSFAETGLI